jgi:hypothetical protein
MHLTTIVGLVLALASTTLISLSYLREHGAVASLDLSRAYGTPVTAHKA